MGWSKAEIDNSDLWDLVDIMDSGKEKGPVPFDELNVDSLDLEQMKKDLQEDGKWPQNSNS